jgi:hypothetical protein
MDPQEIRNKIYEIEQEIDNSTHELTKLQALLGSSIDKDITNCDVFIKGGWRISICRWNGDISVSLSVKNVNMKDLTDLIGFDKSYQMTENSTIMEHDDEVMIRFEHNTPIEDCIQVMKDFNISLTNEYQANNLNHHEKEVKEAKVKLEEIDSIIELINEGN